MKFKLVKSNCKNVGAYGVSKLSTGDTFELDGRLAEKAKNNPDFSEVLTRSKKVKKHGNSGGNKR